MWGSNIFFVFDGTEERHVTYVNFKGAWKSNPGIDFSIPLVQ
jgi:hypothetical protein